MDPDRNSLVTVEFSDVKFDASFDKDAFDMKKNMTGAQLDVPVMAEGEDKEFTVKYPVAEIPGVTLIDEKEITTENGKRVVLTYDGEKIFHFDPGKSRRNACNVLSDQHDWKACRSWIHNRCHE